MINVPGLLRRLGRRQAAPSGPGIVDQYVRRSQRLAESLEKIGRVPSSRNPGAVQGRGLPNCDAATMLHVPRRHAYLAILDCGHDSSALIIKSVRRPSAARTTIDSPARTAAPNLDVAGGSQPSSGAGLMDPDGTSDVASLYAHVNTGSSQQEPSLSSEPARHDVTCDRGTPSHSDGPFCPQQ